MPNRIAENPFVASTLTPGEELALERTLYQNLQKQLKTNLRQGGLRALEMYEVMRRDDLLTTAINCIDQLIKANSNEGFLAIAAELSSFTNAQVDLTIKRCLVYIHEKKVISFGVSGLFKRISNNPMYRIDIRKYLDSLTCENEGEDMYITAICSSLIQFDDSLQCVIRMQELLLSKEFWIESAILAIQIAKKMGDDVHLNNYVQRAVEAEKPEHVAFMLKEILDEYGYTPIVKVGFEYLIDSDQDAALKLVPYLVIHEETKSTALRFYEDMQRKAPTDEVLEAGIEALHSLRENQGVPATSDEDEKLKNLWLELFTADTFPPIEKLLPIFNTLQNAFQEKMYFSLKTLTTAQMNYVRLVRSVASELMLDQESFLLWWKKVVELRKEMPEDSPALALLTRWVLYQFVRFTTPSDLEKPVFKILLDTSESSKIPDRADRRFLYHMQTIETERMKVIIINYLSRPDTPPHLFRLFARRLIAEDIFPHELETLLATDSLHPFLKKLLKEKTDAFPEVIQIIHQLKLKIQLVAQQELLLDALTDLGMFGPTLFVLYCKARKSRDPEILQHFLDNINIVKEKFFQNISLNELRASITVGTKKQKDALLIDFALAAYRPRMDSKKVRRMFNKISDSDTVASLDRTVFKREGYRVVLHRRQMNLKPNVREEPFPFEIAMKQSDVDEISTDTLVAKILKITSLDEELETMKAAINSENKQEIGQEISRKKSTILNEIGKVFSILSITPQLHDATGLHRYDYLQTIQKVLGSIEEKNGNPFYLPGVDYRDNFMYELEVKTVNRLSNQEREKIDTLFLKYMRPEAEKLSRELKKYQLIDSDQHLASNFIAHMTHSAQSFLARSRMGLCTEEDTPRYNKPDTWHLDLIDTTSRTLEGSVICYNLASENTLVLRQFNAIGLLNIQQLSAGSFCTEMIRICVEFAEQNHIKFIGFPPQKSGEDLLSNDQRMWKYLQARFCLEKYAHTLAQSYLLGSSAAYRTTYSIEMMYRIPVDDLKKMLVAA